MTELLIDEAMYLLTRAREANPDLKAAASKRNGN